MIIEMVRLGVSFRELSVRMIYLDPARTFLDGLDNPLKRLDYYRSIIMGRGVSRMTERTAAHR
jgi:hypothetical protein